MPEDEIDRIVDRIANRIRNNPREPLSDHQLAHLPSFNAKHARFFEAKLMQWAAARLEAFLTAEPADEDEGAADSMAQGEAGTLGADEGGRRR
jgi:hypothetical protein